jgi:hypothetical protein
VEFEEVVSKALEKDRSQRYQSIAEFAASLQQLKDQIKSGALVHNNDVSLDAQTIKTRTATGPQAQHKTESRSVSKGRTLSIALSLIVAVGVVTVLLWKSRSPSLKDKIDQTSSQLTNQDGFISAARFGPDGKRLFYSAGFDGNPLELF